jgi:CelD/BcsL family acetyltransferase involved in cellulose biosynthesis
MVLACASPRTRAGRIAVYEISSLTTVDDLERLRPEWTALFESSRVPNPFAHPDWLILWAQHFADPFDLYVLAIRSGNELVGVAPFFRRSVSLVGGRVTCLRMLGGGRNSKLTEMPQVLTAPRQSRRILRALVGHLCANGGDWDWVEIELGLTQGWFEREWIPMHGVGSGSVPIHKGVRAFVVLPLAPTWEVQRAQLKRNVKESIRRGANRLGREGHDWRIVEPDGSKQSLERSLATLIELHKARARLTGTEPHSDYFDNRREEAFLYDVGRRMHPSGSFTPLVLEVDGEEVAARLVLDTADAAFFSVSGSDPAWWRYSAGTTLLAGALRRAIERGETIANLSHGPDVSKLRWSEEIQYAHSFLLVGERLRSRVAFAAFWHLRAEYMLRDQRRRHIGRKRPAEFPELEAPQHAPPVALPEYVLD